VLYFVAGVTGLGTELFRSDGTAAGTFVVRDLAAGIGSSFPELLTAAGNRLYFTAITGGQREIWTTDGTFGGTIAVTNRAFGRISAYTDLTATTAGLFFLTDDLTGLGSELWITNGTLASTHLVLDIGPGQISGPQGGMLSPVLGGSQLLFGATDLTHGLQLWISDGTAIGTQRVSSIGGPGYGFGSLGQFFATGTRVFFAAADGINGVEPWYYDPTTAGVAFALRYGRACNGSNGAPSIGAQGLPTLGNTAFAITLQNALANSFALQVASFTSSSIALGSCRQNVGFPMVTGSSGFTDAAGAFAAPFPIPIDPGFLGLNLFFQWGIADPVGGIFGSFSASEGLQVRIGP
jgi:ELWxxDGT repeat protein